MENKTCRTCANIGWKAYGRYVSVYCRAKKDNRTFDGFKKVEIDAPACKKYKIRR